MSTPGQHPPLPDRLLPVLPMIYAVWADGMLTSAELHRIRAELRERPGIDVDTCEALDRWLDPEAPPSASALAGLRERIREWNGPLWTTPEGRELLTAGEEVMGILGEEAIRDILEADAPPGGHPDDDVAARIGPPPPPVASSPSFDPETLRRYVDADHLDTRDRVMALLHEEEFRIPPHLPRQEHRERVFVALKRLAGEGLGSLGYPEAYGGGGDPGRALVVFETLAYGDLSLTIKWGVQFGLWGGSVLQLGTERHHSRYLRDIGTLALPGCYAMTELSHGSNVREIETTAHWIQESQEFEIHTPHELAGKEWIGNAALHGHMATVFAQLRVGDEDHGVHAFLVPLRDEGGKTLPGIRIEDCGWKVGLNGIDNGRIWFSQVRVPRENLLNRFAEVTPEGSYESPIPGAGKRFFTMLGTLVTGRISIAGGALVAARTGLTIAVRFSERRRQFGPAGGGEVPVMDYLTQQRLLLPKLATTYALTFALRGLVRRYAALQPGDEEEGRELDGLAAGLKAAASWHALDTLQACREACGGQGYRSDNRFGQLKADVDVFTTFEGANVVLLQLVAKGLLTRFREEMGDLKVWGMVKFLAERAGTRVTELNPVVTRRTDEEHLRDFDFHRAAFRYREERLLISAARRLKGLIDEGVDSFEAMNRVQDHLVELAMAHVERASLEALHLAVVKAPTPGTSETLRSLAELHALERMEAHRGWYLESGYIDAPKAKAIRSLVNTLCGEVREDALFLVDAFGIPDSILGAPAGLHPHGVGLQGGED